MILSCGHEYFNVSGRRKSCPVCAKERIREAERKRHLATCEYKRGPHKPEVAHEIR